VIDGAARLESWEDVVREGAAALGIEVSDDNLAAYRTHLELLLQHNARAGLTSITDPADIAIKHFVDSLTCLLAREIAPGDCVADVGSGAGFPGLVLAVARPHAQYTLIESNRKRADFLREAISALSLSDVTVLAERAEHVGRLTAHRESYDLAVSRAVAPLPVLLEQCLPLVSLTQRLIAQKGPSGEEEVERSSTALDVLGGRVVEVRRVALPGGKGTRALVVVEKVAPTPDRYPRRPGIPSKRPL
jgi:16S rRNA (guanine527-N7)-methyltransferase